MAIQRNPTLTLVNPPVPPTWPGRDRAEKAPAITGSALYPQAAGTLRPAAPAQSSALPTMTTQDTLDAIKIVLSLVAGIGAVVALTVAYRKQRLNEAEAHREDTKVVLDRFCRSAELLGSPDASVRIAGIYAYAALANDAPEARQGCIDVLCAYLRQPYAPPTPDEGTFSGSAPVQPAELPGLGLRDGMQERQVRWTIIRLVRDNLHLPETDPRTWRGHDFNFSGAVFDGGDFTGATFTGTGTVSFDDTLITGRLSFDGATFAGGIISFDGARFDGGSICLDNTHFTGGVVDLSHIDRDMPPSSPPWPAGPVPAGLLLPAPQE